MIMMIFGGLLTQYIQAMPGVEVVGEAIDGVDVIDKDRITGSGSRTDGSEHAKPIRP